jgi:amidase
MGKFAEYSNYDGLGLAELVRSKQVTPAELVEEAIERIEALNPKVNAVIHKLYERARREVQQGLPEGPFSGVPFFLKEIQSYLAAELHTSCSRYFEGYRPERNSELVDRYLASGVVVLGKTNAPEFGLLPATEPELFGPTRNPWNPELTTSGSSGGSAASVAARMVPLAGGGDGGGSIRTPSSCCGLVGLKPTRGRTPVGPQEAEMWNGFAIEHVLTRSVRDSAAMLDCISGPCLGDSHYLPRPETSFLDEVKKEPGKLRIAYGTESILGKENHPDCLAGLQDTLKLLGQLGHQTEEVNVPIEKAAFSRAFAIMAGAYVWALLSEFESVTGKKVRRPLLERETWLTRALGLSVHAGRYVQSIRLMQREARKFLELTESYDVLLHPTLVAPPKPLGFLQSYGWLAWAEAILARVPVKSVIRSNKALDDSVAPLIEFSGNTPVFNVSGQPSMSLPLYYNGEGLPIGMMFTGRFGDEATLFRLAGQLEKARPWKDKKPPICG